MRYIWQVIDRGWEPTGDAKCPVLADMQCGVVETFSRAMSALSAWRGSEDDPVGRIYQVIPVLEDQVNIEEGG